MAHCLILHTFRRWLSQGEPVGFAGAKTFCSFGAGWVKKLCQKNFECSLSIDLGCTPARLPDLSTSPTSSRVQLP